MQVEFADEFPYPNFFAITGRASGAGVEKVGVFIVKQTIQLDGSIGEQQEILMADAPFDPERPAEDEPDFDATDMAIRIESDIVPFKPGLDVAAVRDGFSTGVFGQVRIDRGAGLLPDPPLDLDYGWRSRLDDPRKSLAGDAENFEPDIADPSKLPAGFDNGFFNGSRLTGSLDLATHLSAGQTVEFDGPAGTVLVTIPPGPSLEVTIGATPVDPPVAIDLGADTVLYDVPAGHFLVTWRAVFPWEERLADATLEVS